MFIEKNAQASVESLHDTEHKMCRRTEAATNVKFSDDAMPGLGPLGQNAP